MDTGPQISFPMKFFLLLSVVCLCTTALARDPLVILGAAAGSGRPLIDTLYQFGDSISDTGNWMREDRVGLCTTFPYGESYFHFATGRCSDGLLMVDFYAEAFGLQFLHPYLEKDGNFRDGVNFAVGGATALNQSYLESIGIDVTGDTNSSLAIQLGWFQEYLESTCPVCKSKLGSSLILMEDIGGDDYHLVTISDLSLQVAYDLVPDVIGEIVNAIQEMILMGVVHVLVPSVFPLGCTSAALVSSMGKHPHMYDDLGCRRDFNEMAEYHNAHLQKAIQQLQIKYPDANLMYGDYYSAILGLMRNASSLGFEEDAILTTCCGHGDNPYNFNLSTECGTLGVPVCPRPETRVQWDGYHFTQRFYMYLSKWMLEHTILPRLSRALSS